MRTKIITIIMIILIVLTFSVSTFATTQSELNKLKEEQSNAKSELNSIQQDKATATSDLETINSQISSLNSEISQLQIQLDDLNDSITSKEQEITEKQKELEEKEELLKKRMIALYKGGGTSYLDVLLGSSNYLDMLSSYDVVSEIADADTNLMNQITDEKTSLENAKSELESKKSEVENTKAQKNSKNTELKSKQAEKQTAVSKLSDQEKATQAEIDANSAAITAAETEMARNFQKAQSKASGINFDGSFIWPCTSNIVTSRMKYRWGRWHKGIDINASYENVFASASGYAYNATNPGGYGTYIMIYHGSGYVTLYGHLSSSKVYDGEYVKQGQVIAVSGNTGGSTGPHLHFEIRQASSMASFFSTAPLDPLDYLPGGYTIASGA